MKINLENFNKDTIANVIICTFFTFNLCLFAPLELYLTNIDELWFPIGNLFLGTIITSIIIFLALLALTTMVKNKYRSILLCIIFGLGIGFYIQGNLMTFSYGLLDGHVIDWNAYTKWGLINSSTWLLCIILPFIALKYKEKLFYNLTKLISGFIILIQIVTIIILIITTPLDKDSFAFSDKGMLTLSSNTNVVVFVLDTFDNNYLKEIISNDPETNNKLKDFTFFSNMISPYVSTKGALPFILTGIYNENQQPYKEYINESFEKTAFYRDLKRLNFDTRLYTNSIFVSQNQNKVIDNIDKDGLKVSSNIELMKSMYKFTAFRYVPHYFKNYFWLDSSEFNDLKEDINGSPIEDMYNNVDFYNKLSSDKIEIQNNNNCFRLYHLQGVHQPYDMNENVIKVNAETNDYLNQAKGCLNIVYEYINQLKKLNIYDSTVVIITGDHGEMGLGLTSPIMLIKPQNSHKEFEISDVPVSLEDFQATIMSQITDNYKKYGVSMFDIKPNVKRDRRYLYYNPVEVKTNKNYLPDMMEYLISNDIDDQLSIKPTGKIFTQSGIKSYSTEVPLGKDLTFKKGGLAYHFFREAFYDYEGNFAWSKGNADKLRIVFKQMPKDDIIATFKISSVYDAPQRLIVKCEGDQLFDQTLDKKGLISFTIPKELIKNNRVILDLGYPIAKSPYSYGNTTDKRTLAFAFNAIRFDAADKIKGNYSLGEEILFTKDGLPTKYFKSGLSLSEGDFTWTNGKSSNFELRLDESPSNGLKARLTLKSIYNPPQQLIIKSRDRILYNQMMNEPGEIDFEIPKELAIDKNINLAFEYPNAVSPASINNGNPDERVLAFAFTSMKFEEERQ